MYVCNKSFERSAALGEICGLGVLLVSFQHFSQLIWNFRTVAGRFCLLRRQIFIM